MIKDGNIVASGNHENLIKDSKEYIIIQKSIKIKDVISLQKSYKYFSNYNFNHLFIFDKEDQKDLKKNYSPPLSICLEIFKRN